eukprot:TRINITY_DN402_c2_g1_i1.p1 TRINITY_DN402_c2_g1~~TRINITY_DN402_c2_g1_i1.p1  ORF type:complete len:142 (-),score=3.07 TRINITY_DN402_c2_g1_i1:57-482(-)
MFVCKGCSKEIKGNGIEAANSKWHPDCFSCQYCEKKITGAFVQKYDRIFCGECERILFGNYCGENAEGNINGMNHMDEYQQNLETMGCGNLITNQIATIQNKTFHPNCLKCMKCIKTPAPGDLFQREGNLFCSQCIQFYNL